MRLFKDNNEPEAAATESEESTVLESISEVPVSESLTEFVTEEAAETHEGQAMSLYTGLWIDEDIASLRPIAIMMENTKAAMPLYGISQADVVYECPVEGGITRFMAIMQDYTGLEKIGNIRSCRTYYMYFAKEFDAVYFHCGQSHFAKEILSSGFLDHVDYTTGKAGSYSYRTSDKSAPHNLYTSSSMIADALDAYGYTSTLTGDEEPHYNFADEGTEITLDEGTSAVKVSLYYSNNKPWWEYNESDGLYYRYQFSAAQTDGNTGEQLTAKNIIIMECEWYLWEESTGYLYIEYMGSGSGKYITNGKCIDITWKRESEEGPTIYYDSDGNEITLNRGVTWIQVAQDTYADSISIE
ncbi:MAG: DUF3048 domain-containing protein [Clostridiales bacterium]|nr:DUF3048 domain-containing protein [Clostridiales bacterium]